MQSTTNEAVAQITIAPLVQLVDLEGHPVPDCERHVPTCPPDPEDPRDWPAWTDSFFWEPDYDFEYDRTMAMFEDLEPDAPDADPMIHFAGTPSLAERMAPIAGGSPEAEDFIPTDEDWRDYRRWCAEVDARDAARRAEDLRDLLNGYE